MEHQVKELFSRIPMQRIQLQVLGIQTHYFFGEHAL